MPEYSWDRQLADIKQQIAAVFGRDMLLSERAKQAFLTSASRNADQICDHNVLCELLCVSPSCALALTEIGWDYEWTADWRPERPQPMPPMPNLALRLFKGMDESSASLTPAAEMARKRGILTDTDILLSITETSIYEDARGYIGTLAAHFIEDGWHDNPNLTKQIKTFRTREALDVLRGALSRVEWLDPAHSDQQFAIFLDEAGSLRVRPFGAFGSVKPEGVASGAPSVIYRGGIVQPLDEAGPSLSNEKINELEDMMNSRFASEYDFQKFFEHNPDILAGMDYKRIHPHLVLHRDEGKSLIPDFFMERLSSDFCDLLDLKLPYHTLVRRLRKGSRACFRSTVEVAKAQLLEYRDWFNDCANRQEFHQKYGLKAFRPRMILVVGRREHFLDEVERIGLEPLNRDFIIWTYDDIVERARRFRQLVLPRRIAATDDIAHRH